MDIWDKEKRSAVSSVISGLSQMYISAWRVIMSKELPPNACYINLLFYICRQTACLGHVKH